MNSRIKWIVKVTLMVLGMVSMGQVSAAEVVYENVGFIENTGHISDAFTIDAEGSYKATLTDFDFPNLFGRLSLNVTTATTSQGILIAPGSFVFDAQPGTYYANLFGVAAGPLNLGLFGVQIDQVESLTAAPVSIPATTILLASGLGLFLTIMWRRQKRIHDEIVTKVSYSAVTV